MLPSSVMVTQRFLVPHLLVRVRWGQHRGVAQLAARLLWEQEVPGSNPGTPTKINIAHSLTLRQICPASRLTYVQD